MLYGVIILCFGGFALCVWVFNYNREAFFQRRTTYIWICNSNLSLLICGSWLSKVHSSHLRLEITDHWEDIWEGTMDVKREIQDRSGPVSGGENPWDGQKYHICSCRLWHSDADIWQDWSLSSWSSLCLSVSRCCRNWQHIQGMLVSLQSACCLNAKLIQQISSSMLLLNFHLPTLSQESPCGPSQSEI